MGCGGRDFLFPALQYSAVFRDLLGGNGGGDPAASSDQFTPGRLLHQHLHHLDVLGLHVRPALRRPIHLKLVDFLGREEVQQEFVDHVRTREERSETGSDADDRGTCILDL